MVYQLKQLLFFIFFTLIIPLHLYSQPVSLSNFSISTDLQNETAIIQIEAVFRISSQNRTENYSMVASIQNQSKEVLAESKPIALQMNVSSATASCSFTLDSYKCWNAELPHLYSLNLSILDKERKMYQDVFPIGLRSIRIQQEKLELNSIPIRLKGYDIKTNNIIPLETIEAEFNSIESMNVNAAFVSSKFVSEEFLEFCDENGFYIILDLSKSHWRECIIKYQYHPSILLWAIDAREIPDPITWYHQVRQADPSRPVMMCSTAEDDRIQLWPLIGLFEASVNDLSMIRSINHPVLFFPVPSSSIQEVFQCHQEIQRQSNGLGIIVSSPTSQTDGELFDDEITWFYHRLFSPIGLSPQENTIRTGRRIVEIEVQNRFDFLNLRDLDCDWQLQEDNEVIQEGQIQLDLPAGERMDAAFPLQIPEDFEGHEYFLKIRFYDKNSKVITEHTSWLHGRDWEEDLVQRLSDLTYDKEWNVTANLETIAMSHQSAQFDIRSGSLEWFLRTQDQNIRLITGGPNIFIKTQNTSGSSNQPEMNLYSQLSSNNRQLNRIDKNVEIISNVYPQRTEEEQPKFSAQIDWLASPYGYVDIRFSIMPEIQNANILQAGLEFLVPPTLNHLTYVGEGPYPFCEEMDFMTLPGIYHFDLLEEQVPPFSRKVRAIALTDHRGDGLGILVLNQPVGFFPSIEGTTIRIHTEPTFLCDTQFDSRRIQEKRRMATFRVVPILRGKSPNWFWEITQN